jgi:hypothetical protein
MRNDEMILYMQTYAEGNADGLLTLSALLRLSRPAGIQGKTLGVCLPSGVIKLRYRTKKNGTVFFTNIEKSQEYDEEQLLASLEMTQASFKNHAFAYIDNEARSLNDVILDLDTRAERSIIENLMRIDSVLCVMFSKEKVIALRDPKKQLPALTPLQRAMVRCGHVTFESIEGEYHDNFERGDMVVPGNTNPLTSGVADLVTAETGTLGHFLSTPAEGEEEGSSGEDGEEGEEENPDHYGITIGHALQDGTERATLLHLSNNSQESELTVCIPTQFRRTNSVPSFFRPEMPWQLSEAGGCLQVPKGAKDINCIITNIDCGCLYDILGMDRPSIYGADLDPYHARMIAAAD